MESSGIESMLSFFRSLRMDRFGAMKDYKRNLGYYSIKQIEFYVEIDKPGNQTIHDTSVVKIHCDTTQEIFAAEYEDT